MGSGQRYVFLLGLYGAASAAFIFARVREDHLRFFDIPVFLTILTFVEFGLAPLECFLAPARLPSRFAGDPAPLVQALLYVIAGMAAFWAGCLVAGRKFRREKPPSAEGAARLTGRRRLWILQATVGIYAVALIVKFYLLAHQLYSYLGSGQVYFQNLAMMQVMNVVEGIGTYALVIAGIEKYLEPRDRRWNALFWAIFASECLWGLISGMKGVLLENFVLVALISSLVQRRFRKGWVISAVLGAVALYPVSNAYRNLVRGGQGPGTITSFAGAVELGQRALERVNGAGEGPAAELLTGLRSTVARLDLLQNVGLILSLGSGAKQLLGGERWWMLPLYPFIPRFLWSGKPVLIEGGRFSLALGFGGAFATPETVGTSTGPTYPGDLYVRGGVLAIVAGMSALGFASQWLASLAGDAADRRSLFLYAAIFLTATDMEIDAFSFWSGLLKAFVILSVLAWFVYGPRRHPSKRTGPLHRAFAQP